MTTNTQLVRRSAAAVLLLPLITFGIYSIVWCAKTRGEVKRAGAPMSTWWLLCPFGAFWYFWSLAKGINAVTGLGTGGNYALMLLLGNIGQAIVLARVNGLDATAATAPSVPVVA
ncbi:DUF4234 domain-containing protein [Frigoribacterium sp. CFBP 13712]|uniref:DUF4234 domain-containing protein n=1 Tax=Frigoribacterium sp. CFBP 13712 TaxID=2775309 RepID=UPI00177F9481|nr:DUF4234 domain-containing protein [Frigoribacterium sp. CFBP 13712]MBD8703709.1 DUF4234 domain-containing protein [Frigoribacterium sp. CFBP 13712]